jgi:hypothetical protein
MTQDTDGEYRIDDEGNVIVDVGDFTASVTEDGTITLIIDAGGSENDTPEREQLERLLKTLVAMEASRGARPEYWASRGSVHVDLGLFDAAVRDLTRAIELDDQASYRSFRAGAFYKTGHYRDATLTRRSARK